MKVVKITWFDACTTDDGWIDISDEHGELSECYTVGYLVSESDTHYSVASTVCAENQCNCVIRIPRDWAQKVVRIDLPDESGGCDDED